MLAGKHINIFIYIYIKIDLFNVNILYKIFYMEYIFKELLNNILWFLQYGTIWYFEKRELYIEVLKRDGLMIQFIPEYDQKDELVYIALESNMYSFIHIKNQKYNVCKYVCEIDGLYLRYVENKRKELFEISIKSNYFSLRYIPIEKQKIKYVKIALLAGLFEYSILDEKFHKLKLLSKYTENLREFLKNYFNDRTYILKKNISYYIF
jgi:hypothetical protein